MGTARSYRKGRAAEVRDRRQGCDAAEAGNASLSDADIGAAIDYMLATAK